MEIVDVKKEAGRAVSLAVGVLKRGGILIYPTDTLYGLGANARDKEAVSHLMKIKGRSAGLVFSVMLSDVGELVKLVRVKGEYREVLKKLPGPYTFIFPTKVTLPNGIGGKQIGLGVRIPNHPLALEIVREFNAPIITTSVNKTGEPPLSDPDEIVEMFEDDVDLFLDSGKITGEPSTIISFVSRYPKIIRKGAGDISFLKEFF